MHPHLSGDMSRNYVTVFQLHSEHSVRECLNDGSVLFYRRLFRHIMLSCVFLTLLLSIQTLTIPLLFLLSQLRRVQSVRLAFRRR